MEEAVKDLGGAEARDVAMQFIAQNMGALKDLNSRIVEQSTTMRPIDPNIRAVVNSIPGVPQVNVSAPRPSTPYDGFLKATSDAPLEIPPEAQASFTFTPAQPIATQPVAITVPRKEEGQLELNFTFDAVHEVNRRLDKIESSVRILTDQLDRLEKMLAPKFPLKKSGAS